MFLADGWSDFRVLNAGNGMKLERWKDITLLRPDPQAVWPMAESAADAVYLRLRNRRRALGVYKAAARTMEDTVP